MDYYRLPAGSGCIFTIDLPRYRSRVKNRSAVGRRKFLATGFGLDPGQHDDGEREP